MNKIIVIIVIAVLVVAGYIFISGALENNDLDPNNPAGGESSLAPLYAYEWNWLENQNMDQETTVAASDSSEFVLVFEEGNRFTSSTDCNSLSGSYTVTEGVRISMGEIASTRMACPEGSLEQEYTQTLSVINELEITDWEYGSAEGSPTLLLSHADGQMVFTGIAK